MHARRRHVALALVLECRCGARADGLHPPAPPAPAPPRPRRADCARARPPRTGKTAVDEAKAECMRLWDAGTHMSKREWASTCDRIQTRLDNLKVENLDVMGTGVRKKAGGGQQGSIDSPSRTN